MITVDIVREATSTDLNRMSKTSRKEASKEEKENRETGAHMHVSPTEIMCEQYKKIKPSEASNNC